MQAYLSLIGSVSKQYWRFLLSISLGFVIVYYCALLLLTMLRFGEVPNYVEFYNIFHIYALILEGTPSMMDAIPIMLDEAWFEAGYKNPLYYGVATWSFMLIPPKVLLVFFMGLMMGLFIALVRYGKNAACNLQTNKRLYAAAGVSSVFISLTSATLTWVVCCATPSWVVALAMLGMSASLALWLEPLGNFLTVSALLLMAWIIFRQLNRLIKASPVVLENY